MLSGNGLRAVLRAEPKHAILETPVKGEWGWRGRPSGRALMLQVGATKARPSQAILGLRSHKRLHMFPQSTHPAGSSAALTREQGGSPHPRPRNSLRSNPSHFQ